MYWPRIQWNFELQYWLIGLAMTS